MPGPVLRKLLDASVHDLCAAFARRELATRQYQSLRPRGRGHCLRPWADAHADDAFAVLDALRVAVGAKRGGEPRHEPALCAVVEAVNRGRDLHVAVTLDGLEADALDAETAPLAALVDAGDGAVDAPRVAAAALLGLELADLAAIAQAKPAHRRPGAGD